MAGPDIVGRNGMLNSYDPKHSQFRRVRGSRLALTLLLTGMTALTGCTQTAMRLQSPEALEDVVSDIDLVREMTVPFGTHPWRVDAVGLVVNLSGTGSDPPLGPGRKEMVEEIQRRGVENADAFLSSSRTSLVKVRGYLPPGTQKGDPIDIEVLVPRNTDTSSLAGGLLLETSLREYVRLGGRYREGEVSAIAKGPLLVDPVPDQDRNPESQLRAQVLGGAIAMKSRPLGLTLRPDSQGVQNSRRIGESINSRFYYKLHGRTVGVATPKSDEYIELTVHPRYKNNVRRFLAVVRSVAVSETDKQRHARVRLLGRQLVDSISSSSAALRLEALGKEGVEALKTGITSSNAEVRFYSAEALAYLDEPEAAAPLAEAARDEPAFRAAAFSALSVMDSPEAYDALVDLLDAKSAEARYGAFHAMWKMNPRHPLVSGENLGDQMTLHRVRSEGPPMVHVTRSRRPEVVLFGSDVSFVTPMVLDAGRHIMINGSEDGRIKLTRFTSGSDNQSIEVANRVDEVIRGIVQLGGGYPDVVDALTQAKSSRSLACRFKVDAIATEGRPYRKPTHLANPVEPSAKSKSEPASGFSRLRAIAWPGEDEPSKQD